MSLMQETIIDRLWTKYEHRFGHPPPITSASLDEAIATLRRELHGEAATPYRYNDIGNSGNRPIAAP